MGVPFTFAVILIYEAEQPRSQSGSFFLNVQYSYWDSELYYGGAEKMAMHPWDQKETLSYYLT